MEIAIITSLIFFLLLSAIGVCLYLYLRKWQNRVLHKDEYYEKTFEEFYIKRKRIIYKPQLSSAIIERLFILYGTFVGVIALFLFGSGIISGGVIQGLGFALLSIVISPFILLIFPIGVDMFFDPTSQGGIIGYILYLLILWFTSTLEENQSFTFVYIFFVILIIINLVGCSHTDLSGLS